MERAFTTETPTPCKPPETLVAFTAEFAAGVQNGKHDLDGGDLLLGMLVHGNTAAVVLAGDGIVGMDGHLDGIAVPGQGPVHSVVDHLVNQVVQTAGAGGADTCPGVCEQLQVLLELECQNRRSDLVCLPLTLLRSRNKERAQMRAPNECHYSMLKSHFG